MVIKEFDFSKLDENHFKDWNMILQNNNSNTVFQTPEWIRLSLKWSVSNGSLILAYNDSKPVGAYFYYKKPHKYFLSKSSTGIFESPYGGPVIIEGENDKVYDLMIQKLERKILISNITVIVPPFANVQPFLRSGFKDVVKETMVLELDKPEEELFAQMHQMKRRNIKKALKNGIQIIHKDVSGLDEYHSMLVSTYERLNLKAPRSISYYKDVFEALGPKKRILLSIAYLDDKPIASGLFLIYNSNAIFWQGASYQEFMKFGANDLIHWDMIQYCKAEELSYYNLLHFHDDQGNELESLKRFKEGFGAKSTPYHLLVKKSKFLN